MLENVEGDTIEAIRENLLDEPVERLKQLFLGAWKELKRIHAMQIAHCDIREENLIVSREGSFVFVDWEASKYGFAPLPPPSNPPANRVGASDFKIRLHTRRMKLPCDASSGISVYPRRA